MRVRRDGRGAGGTRLVWGASRAPTRRWPCPERLEQGATGDGWPLTGFSRSMRRGVRERLSRLVAGPFARSVSVEAVFLERSLVGGRKLGS